MSDDLGNIATCNDANISIAETKLVKAFVYGMLAGSEPMDRFSTWLLAGTGATAALYISGMASILPIISYTGFRVTGAILVLSGICGLLAKSRASRVSAYVSQEKIMLPMLAEAFDYHGSAESEIRDLAASRGIDVNTAIDQDRLNSRIVALFPRLLQARQRKALVGSGRDLDAANRRAIFSYVVQGYATSGQVIFFVLFVVSAISYISAGTYKFAAG